MKATFNQAHQIAVANQRLRKVLKTLESGPLKTDRLRSIRDTLSSAKENRIIPVAISKDWSSLLDTFDMMLSLGWPDRALNTVSQAITDLLNKLEELDTNIRNSIADQEDPIRIVERYAQGLKSEFTEIQTKGLVKTSVFLILDRVIPDATWKENGIQAESTLGGYLLKDQYVLMAPSTSQDGDLDVMYDRAVKKLIRKGKQILSAERDSNTFFSHRNKARCIWIPQWKFVHIGANIKWVGFPEEIPKTNNIEEVRRKREAVTALVNADPLIMDLMEDLNALDQELQATPNDLELKKRRKKLVKTITEEKQLLFEMISARVRAGELRV